MSDATVDPPALAIATDMVCHIIVKAREFDGQDVETDPDSGSNAADDGGISVLEEHDDDPTQDELIAFIEALDEDEQVDLVALLWLGRGDGDLEEWENLKSSLRHGTPATSGPRPIFSVSPCSPTTWPTGSRPSACPARISRRTTSRAERSSAR